MFEVKKRCSKSSVTISIGHPFPKLVIPLRNKYYAEYVVLVTLVKVRNDVELRQEWHLSIYLFF